MTSAFKAKDLHLGKTERIARRGGAALPPYETQDTLDRLSSDLDATGARQVVCLGDSFDDLAAARALPDTVRLEIARLQAGRQWVWIEGNHDPGPVEYGGTHMADWTLGPLTLRHIAQRVQTRARPISRPAFLIDAARIIMPAYGTYTGGLWSHTPTLQSLMAPDALAILTGARALAVPMPRSG